MKTEKLNLNNIYISYLRSKGIKIGSNCVISHKAMFGTEPYLISIGNNVRITNGCRFFCHDGSLWVLRNLKRIDSNSDKIAPIKIGNNVNIGWNCIVLPGVSIGDNVIIGAGSVVTKNIPSNTVVAGVPARIIRTLDEYNEKIMDDIIITKGMKKKEKKKYLLSKLGDYKYEKE